MIKASRWLTNQNLGYVLIFCIVVCMRTKHYLMHWQDGNGVPSNEYFYNLKNVTFCGFHPRDHRYFGFITKVRVPACRLSRVTCHVSCCSTPARVGSGTPATCSWASRARGAWPRPTGESSLLSQHVVMMQIFCCRRAFRRFYQKFIETAFPTEDIYLE